MGDIQSGPEPSWTTSDPEVIIAAVRRSEGPVRCVRTFASMYDEEIGGDAPYIRCFYAVRAETEEGWGTFRYSEYLPVEQTTGRIVTTKGRVWRWLQENARDRLFIDRSRSGAL